MSRKLYAKNFANIDWSKKTVAPKKPAAFVESKRAVGFAVPMIVSDYEAYECPVTGDMIEGRHAHSENLKRNDCRLLEPGEFDDCKKNGKKNYLDGIDRAVDKAVDEIAATL